jgi:pyruvate dehydrogenase E1 component alpha subunit
MSQARHQAIKDIADRGTAYGIPGISVDGNDVIAVYEAGLEAVKRARSGQGPTLIECKTYRQRGHFEGDPGKYKPTEEQALWMTKDPMNQIEKYMVDRDFVTADELKVLQDSVVAEIEEAIAFAEASAYPELDSAVRDIYSDIVEEVRVR